MQINEVLNFFEEKKHDYLRNVPPDPHPIGILLGGQGAVGKGQLNHWAKSLYPSKHFLIINGDIYRNRHPNFKELTKDVWNYSKETQVFSNVFTEGLIQEAINQRFSFVVEGTMRSSSVPMRTAEKLRSNGYGTAAFAIAACREFSLLNAFVRYFKEVQAKGFGRMIDIESHNHAVEGLPTSLDLLYQEKAVERICLFDCFAKSQIADYQLTNGNWNDKTMPSKVIIASREQQKRDHEAIETLLNESKTILSQLDNELIREQMANAYNQLTAVYHGK